MAITFLLPGLRAKIFSLVALKFHSFGATDGKYCVKLRVGYIFVPQLEGWTV